MTFRLAGVALIALLLALPAASAVACWQMLSNADECPMEPEGTQPAPTSPKMSCCYVSAVEPATGTAPLKLNKAVSDVVAPAAMVPSVVVAPQPAFALHGLSPGHCPSLQQLNCVFLI